MAALHCQHLIDKRSIRNSKLFYNVANSSHQLDEIGCAIVNYRRAERFDPIECGVVGNVEFKP